MLFGMSWDTQHGELAFAISILPILLRGMLVTIEASLAGFVVALVLGLILTVLKSAKAVVGNSSSGLLEAPSLGIPSVNIGDRQKNRLAAESVQHVPYDPRRIQEAIGRALTAEYADFARNCVNPYDPFRDGRNSWRIVQGLQCALATYPHDRLRHKKFEPDVRPAEWDTLLKEAG